MLLFLLSIILAACGESGLILSFVESSGRYQMGKWSFDNKYLLAEDDDTGKAVMRIWDTSGKEVSSFQWCDTLGVLYTWLPDGTIACFEQTQPRALGIYQFQGEGSPVLRQKIQLEKSDQIRSSFEIQWNPYYGIFALMARYGPAGEKSLLLYGNDGKLLVAPQQVCGADLLSWSPDGKRIATSCNVVDTSPTIADIQVREVTVRGNTVELGSPINAKTGTTYRADRLLWSPSGNWLLYRYVEKDDNYIGLIATDGSGRRVRVYPEKEIGGDAYSIHSWSPNGKQLIVEPVVMGKSKLYQIDMEEFAKKNHITL